ncbi:MAG: HD domain-containing phosphohydrolase [Thiomicrospira sp.]
MSNSIRTRFSIRLTVVSAFALTMTLILLVALSLQYHFNQKLAQEAALSEFQLSAAVTRDYLQRNDLHLIQTAQTLAQKNDLIQDNWITPHTQRLFSETLLANPLLYAIYLGFDTGDFYELVNLDAHPSVRRQLQALDSDRWVEIKVTTTPSQGRVRRFDYYNAAFEQRATRQEASDYDARHRHWYQNAPNTRVHKSTPYLFQHLQAPGQTYSIQMQPPSAVLAMDVMHASLSDYLRRLPLQHEAEIYLYQADGELSASNQAEASTPPLRIEPLFLSASEHEYLKNLPKLKVSNELNWPPFDYAVAGEPRGYAIDVLRLIAQALNIELEFINGYRWPELVAMFERGELDVLHPIVPNPLQPQPGLLSQAIIHTPHRLVTRPGEPPLHTLAQLQGKRLAIPQGWSIIRILQQQYPDIHLTLVDTPAQALRAVNEGDVYATLDIEQVLYFTAKQFFIEPLQFHPALEIDADIIPSGLHLLIQPDKAPLLALFNRAIEQIDASLQAQLNEKWLNPVAINTQPATVPYSELIQLTNQQHNQLHRLRANGETKRVFVTELHHDPLYKSYFAIVINENALLASARDKIKTSLWISLLILLALVPLAWLFANPIVQPIKRLAKENDKIMQRRYDDVVLCDSIIKEVYELAQSLVDMSQAQQQHEQQQARFLDALVEMLAQAIDDKSPYTARHCARVPALAMMLASAAEATDKGVFKDFAFQNDDQRREFRLAAWLHDCGKITTPEHIINKGSKLETLYNRLHEIRMRFEVLWRDAELLCLRQQQADPDNAAEYKHALHLQQRQLQADFAFIAEVNTGLTPLSFDDIERLKILAKRRWTRHFDDRLGLSAQEHARHTTPPAALPVEEPLLRDKTEHLIAHSHEPHYAAELGIKMPIPRYEANLGELYNLSIIQGTLTPEDRFKIDEHVISTIRLLNKVPFPPEYARVPRYASTHHETLNGEGYPRQLQADDLSMVERILAIADIFEALTAADRPYKPAKTIKQALDILYHEVNAGRLDRAVFELLIESGVYLDYAHHYLNESQTETLSLADYPPPASN